MEEKKIEQIGKKSQMQQDQYKETSYNFYKDLGESIDNKMFQKKNVQENYKDPSFDETKYFIFSTICEKENLLIQKACKPEREDFKIAILKQASNNKVHNLSNEWNILVKTHSLDLKNCYVKPLTFQTIENEKINRTMIVMEAGLCSLADIIKERRLKKEFHSEDEIFIILDSLLDGFINLEIHNIAHCDVKPDNLFLFYDQDPEDIFTKLEILEFRSRKKKDFFLSKF